MVDNGLVPNPQMIPEEMKPETAADFVERGWLYYSKKNYDQAISDYHEALSREPDNLDTHYALAMSLKYAGKTKDAEEEFIRVIEMSSSLDDRIRAIMLVRLAKGHISEMKTGSWGDILEQKEKKD